MLDNFVCFGEGKRLTVYVLMKGTTEHLGGALGHGKGVRFGFRVLFIIIITTFTTLDILPRRDVSAHFWGNGYGIGDKAF